MNPALVRWNKAFTTTTMMMVIVVMIMMINNRDSERPQTSPFEERL